MTSFALDFATIAYALEALREQGIGTGGWHAFSHEQHQFLDWYTSHPGELAQLTGLFALASTDPAKLNAALTDRNFAPKFKDPLDGVGVVSILDMLVKWAERCEPTSISIVDGSSLYGFEAFTVPAGGVQSYTTQLNPRWSLIELKTQSGDSFWLQEVDAPPASGVDLAIQAQAMLSAKRIQDATCDGGVTVPMLNMDLDTDLDWLPGLATKPDWRIAQANQQFKLRVNHIGARAQVATSLTLERSMTFAWPPYEVKRHFIGCFTQAGRPQLAIAAFFADYDVWYAPSGNLDD